MRTRPKALLVFSICMMGVALSLPLQAAYIEDFENIFRTLTQLNIVIMILCATSAVAAFNAHKSLRLLLPLAAATVVFNNWWVAYVGFHFDTTDTLFASLGFLGICSVLLEKKTSMVLANPRLKWWNVALRAKIEIPISLTPPLRGQPLLKKSFDISESGFFVQGLAQEELERLSVGEKFNVCLHFSRILKIRCIAKIVRKCNEHGSYPSGVGLQFEKIDSQIKSAIKRLSREKSEAFI